MPRPNWLANPWARNPWFETVAVAQRRAKKRLPWSVYGALVAGSERGVSANDNTAAFAELGFAPHIAGQKPERAMDTTVMGLPVSLPVIISPTGVQAVHPQGEVAVARAAAARGTVMSLSNFASKPVEEVVEACPRTLFQELRSPQTGGACTKCAHYDACRGGCMAAKFFTGLPLDGPDPECALGHGEKLLAARGPTTPPRARVDHSKRRPRSAGALAALRITRPCDESPLAGGWFE